MRSFCHPDHGITEQTYRLPLMICGLILSSRPPSAALRAGSAASFAAPLSVTPSAVEGSTRSDLSAPHAPSYDCQSRLQSLQLGWSDANKATFFARRHDLLCFSRSMASRISTYSTKKECRVDEQLKIYRLTSIRVGGSPSTTLLQSHR
jgi:hypothetical protein